MTLNEFDAWADSFLQRNNYSADISMNGIQVQNSAPDKKEIKKAAFAVDACIETIEKAAEEKADILFVHHGFFWGSPLPVCGIHYNRIKALMDADMALYASHIPLDANKEYGNNYGLARMLGLRNIEPFGEWRGMMIGLKGDFAESVSMEYLVRKLEENASECNVVLPFGPKEVRSAVIISGDGESDAEAAAASGADVFITGEVGHICYHLAKENSFNIIAAGHYNTETIGVSLVMEKLARETGIETVFISAPTGL
ncbi:MAG: Nif3-like dinuclear metal center hexameric protein [Treponemataceae bacterium]|nr:Nif3-like dinuclear metal center hexameric protein [Treponemataceae bacterium]